MKINAFHQDVLNHLPMSFKDAIFEVVHDLQAPFELVFASALSAANAACQGVVDVEPPLSKPVPVSLFTLTVAESGERKSGTDSKFLAGIREFERYKSLGHEAEALAHKFQMRVWLRKLRKLEACCVDADGEAISNLQGLLLEVASNPPLPPRRSRVIYMDATPEALFDGLRNSGRNAFISAAEGGVAVRGRLFSRPQVLCSIWDDEPVVIDRKTSDSFTLEKVRTAVSLMMQPGAFRKLVRKKEGEARDSGLLARTLVCFPESTQGQRFSIPNSASLNGGEGLRRFCQRTVELLEASEAVNAPRKVVKFSTEATHIWVDFYYYVEREIGRGGKFEHIRDFASKAANNMARVAATFEYFTSGSLVISPASAKAAGNLVDFYMHQFLLHVGEKSDEQMVAENAEKLVAWIQRTKVYLNINCLDMKDIMQNGPKGTRKKFELLKVIRFLQDTGHFVAVDYPVIWLNPLANWNPSEGD